MTLGWTRLTSLAVVLTSFALVACSDALNVNGTQDELTGDLGETLRDEVESAIGALTMSTAVAPAGTAAATEGALVIPACVTTSSAADSDGDGVPDDATLVMTAPPCQFTGWRGGTLDLIGQLRIQDPAPANAGFGYDATLTGFRTRYTSADGKAIFDVTRDGTRTLSGSVAGLLLTADLVIHRTFVGQLDAIIAKEWSATFTPAAPLQINGLLPSGALDLAGTVDWTRGAGHYELVVTTPTPLHYNADCTDTVQRVDDGELHAAGTFDGIEGVVLVRWTECGSEPRFTFQATE